MRKMRENQFNEALRNIVALEEYLQEYTDGIKKSILDLPELI